MPRVRLRGIYATALTERLGGAFDVVAPSDAVAARFEAAFETGPADVEIDDAPGRRGVGLVGDPAAVAAVAEALEAVALDALS